MQIRQNLPQFTNKRGLLIVSGTTMAKYYFAHNGSIEQLEQFAVANPRARLQEDYAETTRQGISGAGYDGSKQEMQSKMLHRLSKDIRKLADQYDVTDVYLFSPEHVENAVKNAIPEDVREKIRIECRIDALNFHPIKALELIEKHIRETENRLGIRPNEE